MCSWKCIVIGLLLSILVSAASTFAEPGEITETIAWVGDEVVLECGDDGSNSAQRLWKKGDEVVAVGNFDLIIYDRIYSVKSSAILTIVNVTLEDNGQYTCIVYSTPTYKNTIRLQVKEESCEAPKNPVNGGYTNESVSVNGSFKMNDTIRFYCDPGFELIGDAIHTCNGKHNRWSAEEPSCEAKYITLLKKRWDTLQFKVTDIDTKMTAMMNKVEGMDNRLTAQEAKDRLLIGDFSIVRYKEGSVVSQFTWKVKNIEEEITKAKGNGNYTIDSQPFYTHIPGYRVAMRLHPNRSHLGYVGVYLSMIKGEFDNALSWPFSHLYEFISVSRNGSQIAYFAVDPSSVTTCSVAFLQPPNNTISCGTQRYIKIATLLSNKDQYLIDGALSIQLNVWLSNN